MADIQSAAAEIRQGKKRRRRKNKSQHENIMVCPIPQGDHNQETSTEIYNKPSLIRITTFNTMQNNSASGTQKYYNSNLNNLSPGLVASNDLWPGNRVGPFSKEKVSKEVDK